MKAGGGVVLVVRVVVMVKDIVWVGAVVRARSAVRAVALKDIIVYFCFESRLAPWPMMGNVLDGIC